MHIDGCMVKLVMCTWDNASANLSAGSDSTASQRV